MNRFFASSFQYFAIAALMLSPASAEPDAGHALAQKFAVGEERPPKPVKPQPKKIAESKPATRAPAPGQDYEREMLEAAKAEAAQRQAAEKSQGGAGSQPDTTPAAPPAQTKTEAAQPMRAAPEARPSETANPPEVQSKGQANATASDAQPREAGGNRATILVILNQNGSGEIPKTFDPIICVGDVCHVSGGIESNAKSLSRGEALSSKGSMTPGAGACADSAACAFRGVSIPEGKTLQIVDLGIVRHEEREQVPAKIDPTCTVEDGYLACDKPATSPDYRIWIVPEAIAAKAGADKIAAALDAELPEENITLETDK